MKTLALIGAGRWGKNLARNFHELGVLHTLCDTREAVLDTFQELYPETHMSSNYKAVLDNPKITRVAIAAPALQHYALTKQALLASKDVFVEKPLCLDSAEGEELIHLAEKQGRILMVGHLLQYHPYVRRLQEMVALGDLGKLQYIVSNRLNLGSFRTEENALWNFAPHDISVILSLCGQHLPERVRCEGAAYISKGISDISLTTLQFPGDIRAHIYVSWLNPFKEQKLVVVGSNGMAVFDDTKPWSEKLILYRNHVRWAQGTIPEINKQKPEPIVIAESEPLREECLHFLHCCDERTPSRTDGTEGLRVLKVLQAAQASLNDQGNGKNPNQEHKLSREGGGEDYFAHKTAVVDLKAQVGKGTKIWHFSHIMDGAEIGEMCNIGQNVVVSPEVVLGNNVKVQNNVSLYSGVTCENDVFLGPSMVFTNIANPRSHVDRRAHFVKTVVRKGVTIGANATVLCGIELGEYAFIGAGSVVTKDVKPYALVVGNPARQVGWMSRHGEKLDLPVIAPEEQELTASCPVTQESYRLSGSDLTLGEAAVLA